MTENKGSKIALAVAGFLLVAGAATAVAMTQSDRTDPMGFLGTNNSAQNGTKTPIASQPIPKPSDSTAQSTLENMPDAGASGANETATGTQNTITR